MKIVYFLMFAFLLVASCGKESGAGQGLGGTFPAFSEEKKMWQREFIEMINDEDSYSKDGGSIDAVTVSILECEDGSQCDTMQFIKPNASNKAYSFILDSEDKAIFTNGGIEIINLNEDNSTTDTIFLLFESKATDNFPYASFQLLGENENNNGYIFMIDYLNTEARIIDIAFSGMDFWEQTIVRFEENK